MAEIKLTIDFSQLKAFEKTLEQAAKKFNTILSGKTVKNVNKVKQKFDIIANKTKEIRANTQDMGKNVSRAVKSTSKGVRQMGLLARAADRFMFVITATTAYRFWDELTSLIGNAVDETLELEKGLKEIETLLTSFSGEEIKDFMAEISPFVQNLSVAFGVDLKEAIEGTYKTISAGRTDPQSAMESMVDTMKLAIVTGTQFSSTADVMQTTINNFGVSSVEAGNAVFKIIQKGNLRLEQMQRSWGKLAANAGVAGIKLEVIANLYATLTQKLNPRQAITGLSRAVTRLTRNQDMLNKVQQGGIQALENELLPLLQSEVKEFIGSERAMIAVKAALQGMATERGNMNYFMDEGNVLHEEYTKLLNTETGQLKILEQATAKIFRTMGKDFLPILRVVKTVVAGLGKVLSNTAGKIIISGFVAAIILAKIKLFTFIGALSGATGELGRFAFMMKQASWSAFGLVGVVLSIVTALGSYFLGQKAINNEVERANEEVAEQLRKGSDQIKYYDDLIKRVKDLTKAEQERSLSPAERKELEAKREAGIFGEAMFEGYSKYTKRINQYLSNLDEVAKKEKMIKRLRSEVQTSADKSFVESQVANVQAEIDAIIEQNKGLLGTSFGELIAGKTRKEIDNAVAYVEAKLEKLQSDEKDRFAIYKKYKSDIEQYAQILEDVSLQTEAGTKSEFLSNLKREAAQTKLLDLYTKTLKTGKESGVSESELKNLARERLELIIKISKEQKKVQDAKMKFMDEYRKATMSEYEFQVYKLEEQRKKHLEDGMEKSKVDDWYFAKLSKLMEERQLDAVSSEQKIRQEALRTMQVKVKYGEAETSQLKTLIEDQLKKVEEYSDEWANLKKILAEISGDGGSIFSKLKEGFNSLSEVISAVGQVANSVFSGMIELSNLQHQISMQNAEEEYDARMSNIEKQKQAELDRINSSTMSEQQRANAIAQINESSSKRLEKIQEAKEKKLAKMRRDKALADMQFNYFQGLANLWVNALSSNPTPAGVALASAMSAVMTGFYIANRAKAKKIKYAKGGVLKGSSHSQGGIDMGGNQEAEGGEIILNKNVSKSPLLSKLASFINSATGGVDFAGAVNSTPSQIPETSRMDTSAIVNAIKGFSPVRLSGMSDRGIYRVALAGNPGGINV